MTTATDTLPVTPSDMLYDELAYTAHSTVVINTHACTYTCRSCAFTTDAEELREALGLTEDQDRELAGEREHVLEELRTWVAVEDAHAMEVDSPTHCERCEELLPTMLTDHGADYVAEAAEAFLEAEAWDRTHADLTPLPGLEELRPPRPEPGRPEIVASWVHEWRPLLGRLKGDRWVERVEDALLRARA